MLNTSTQTKAIAILFFLSWLPLCEASVTVKLQEPKWEFLLQNQVLLQTEAQLSSNESNFARSMQPLLAAQNYGAIFEAFSDRNIENDSAALRLLRGQVLLSIGKNTEAEVALKAALKTLPNLALAHRSLSMVYMVDKNYVQARQHLRRSIELGVADAQIYGQLAFVNLQLGQAASAVAGYQHALFLDPDNEQWRQGLLYALINAHAFDQAQALVEEMLQSDGENTNLWLQRSQIALRQERSLQALSSLEVALQLGENSVENIATTAQLHIQGGSPQRAVHLLADNIRLFTSTNTSNIEVIDQVCAWLSFQQDWRSLKKLLQALNGDKSALPARFQSRFNVYEAQMALHKGDSKHARKRLEKAIDVDPTNGEALLTLASLLREHDRAEQSLLLYSRAEALPLYKERALLGRAQLEVDRQNLSEALRLLRQVAQGNPARSDIQANIKSLENLLRNQS